MTEATANTLRRWCRFSVFWYPTVLLGWALAAWACWRTLADADHIHSMPALTMCATLLIALELLPLVQGQGHDPQGVVMSTAFVCALLFNWGPWPAIVMVCLAAAASDARARKSWWKLTFNVGQYALSVYAAYLTMWVFGVRASLTSPLPLLKPVDLVWIVAAWFAYFVLNLVLVIGVVSHGRSYWAVMLDDFGHYTAMTFAVLGISPVIVAVSQTVWWLMPALLIPLVLLYWIAQMSLTREHDAYHDPLTGLPNRASMDYVLKSTLTSSERDTHGAALLLIDLDHFKEVNDNLGHHVGDQLLVEFASRLQASVRGDDHPARLGGDEFAVILPGADAQSARGVAQRIRESLSLPFDLDGISLDIEASIGIATYPDQASSADELLRLADIAMYDAKTHRTTIAAYTHGGNAPDRLSLLSDLRRALEGDELELHYQPKVSLADGAVIGVEALVRWQHPDRGLIAPDAFIPMAEQLGLMPVLTERVLALALAQVGRWQQLGMTVSVAVNVSLTDLLDERLYSVIQRGMAANGVAGSMLQIEITERVVTQHTPELDSVMARLRALGITFSLDDFGTGYSSLLRLQTLPVDELKIDRAFISRLDSGAEAVGIVRSTIDLAHALGIPAIAEGVETAEEWRALAELGCDGAQGWHIARPMAGPQATEWLCQHHAVAAHPLAASSLTA